MELCVYFVVGCEPASIDAVKCAAAAAALLAGIAIDPDKTPSGGAWNDDAAVKALRIADFACGTGTQRIKFRDAFERYGRIHMA